MKKNIIKVKRYQKPLMCLVVIFAILFGIAIGKFINANADEINYGYESNNIDYDNSTSNLNATNVKDAIDELYGKVGQCPSGYNCLTDEEFIATGSKILQAYTYDENSCVTGNETACERTTCYTSNNSGSCPSGTIVDYFVNDTTKIRFHVLHDNGTTMTLQAQKNTVYNVAWYSDMNNQKEGPQTIMAELNRVTNGWNNVKDITLADGMTQFNDGTSANNKCDSTSCSAYDGSYGYPYSTLVNNASIGDIVKARMITITETVALGCTTSEKTCPIYLYNYLFTSESYCRVSGKCINDTHTENGAEHNYGYWTLGADSSHTSRAWYVLSDGRVYFDIATHAYYGARAVVVVNK